MKCINFILYYVYIFDMQLLIHMIFGFNLIIIDLLSFTVPGPVLYTTSC